MSAIQLFDLNGEQRFTGTSVGGGGSQSVVGCVLHFGSLDIHTAADHTPLWDGLVDNSWDGNPLAAIPDGLGLTFTFNGSSGSLTTTEAGTWAFTFALALPGADATLAAMIFSGFTAFGQAFASPFDPFYLVTHAQTLELPTGATAGYTITTVTGATANPYAVGGNLSIVRLG